MTCDHAANVDCQAQPKPDNEEEEEDEEEEEEDSSPVPVPLPVPTIVTLAPAKSTVRTVTTTTERTVPTVPTAPARPKPTRRPTYRPRPTPVTAKDDTPLEEVDNNLDNNHWQYQSSDTLRRQNT